MVITELGVKCSSKNIALPDKHDIAVDRAQYLNISCDFFNPRGTNKHTVHRERVSSLRNRDRCLKTVDLASVAITPSSDCEPTKLLLVGPAINDLLGQQDQPSTGTKRREPVTHSLSKRCGNST